MPSHSGRANGDSVVEVVTASVVVVVSPVGGGDVAGVDVEEVAEAARGEIAEEPVDAPPAHPTAISATALIDATPHLMAVTIEQPAHCSTRIEA